MVVSVRQDRHPYEVVIITFIAEKQFNIALQPRVILQSSPTVWQSTPVHLPLLAMAQWASRPLSLLFALKDFTRYTSKQWAVIFMKSS
jgi:hypothetical protein